MWACNIQKSDFFPKIEFLTRLSALYHAPAKDKSFFLDNQTGTEKLYFMTSRQRDQQLENQYQKILVARGDKNANQT
ncbi:MAG: hypothetical protein DRQ49_17485, partial [Gammaproteobacteria bacterium]